MTEEERAAAGARIVAKAKEINFAHGLPITYEKEDSLFRNIQMAESSSLDRLKFVPYFLKGKQSIYFSQMHHKTLIIRQQNC